MRTLLAVAGPLILLAGPASADFAPAPYRIAPDKAASNGSAPYRIASDKVVTDEAGGVAAPDEASAAKTKASGGPPTGRSKAARRLDQADDRDRLAARGARLGAGWRLQARLYHGGGGGAGPRDSLGCRVVALRTVAIDPRVVPKRSILFIKETVGIPLPGGGRHDGLWYASDTGGAIKGSKIDLFTGHGRGSMSPAMKLNLRTLSVAKAGAFKGCPPPV